MTPRFFCKGNTGGGLSELVSICIHLLYIFRSFYCSYYGYTYVCDHYEMIFYCFIKIIVMYPGRKSGRGATSAPPASQGTSSATQTSPSSCSSTSCSWQSELPQVTFRKKNRKTTALKERFCSCFHHAKSMF
jgi:hypothetical protein